MAATILIIFLRFNWPNLVLVLSGRLGGCANWALLVYATVYSSLSRPIFYTKWFKCRFCSKRLCFNQEKADFSLVCFLRFTDFDFFRIHAIFNFDVAFSVYFDQVFCTSQLHFCGISGQIKSLPAWHRPNRKVKAFWLLAIQVSACSQWPSGLPVSVHRLGFDAERRRFTDAPALPRDADSEPIPR